MKYYVICGERSGDLHASKLIKALSLKDDQAQFRGIGGDLCEKSGLKLYAHYKHVAVMGALEVFVKLITIFKRIADTKKDILAYQPDVIILVDFGGFNMKIAQFAKANNIKVFYYIPPKVWAWNTGRAHKLKAWVDRMYVILPFEKSFFKKYDCDVDYVGNPLKDNIDAFVPDEIFIEKLKARQKPVIAVLPGSRKQEVVQMLDVMLQLAPKYAQYQWVVAGVDNLPAGLYLTARERGIEIVYNKTYELLTVAEAALVTSGTATLETALFRVPQIVCYKTSAITYFLAKLVVKVPFISLVNLIAEKEIVKEKIQSDFNVKDLEAELNQLLYNSAYRNNMLQEYDQLIALVGDAGVSEKTADLMWKRLG
jgi:lipid-A-disaccharide synthase